MKRKILFISCFIMAFICACQSNNLKNIKIKETKLTQETTNKTTELTTNKTTTITTKEKKKTTTTTKKPNIKNQVTIEETNVSDNLIDENHPDYSIHKGRIDCHTEEACMDLSLPIQFKYKNSISNVFYTEVISTNNNVLGYFIEYVFKEFKYSNISECEETGHDIQEELTDRITSFNCQDDGTLKINPDY